MGKKILVVDDSESVRRVVGIALRDSGYEVIEACDGQDAFGKLEGVKVHLIISDVNMPNMDGISFVKALKGHPRLKFTPVIMLTTEAGPEMLEQGRVAGAKAWVVKPFQPRALLDAVAKLVLA